MMDSCAIELDTGALVLSIIAEVILSSLTILGGELKQQTATTKRKKLITKIWAALPRHALRRHFKIM